jgi:hypothetical protein
VLGEAINVGVLFYFSNAENLEFVATNAHRPKLVYTNFDNASFKNYLQIIENKIKEKVTLFNQLSNYKNLDVYIHEHIIKDDVDGLIFQQPIHVKNVFKSNQEAIEQYTKLLLPGIQLENPIITKHNDNYIIKKFHTYIHNKDVKALEKITKNRNVETKHVKLKFDYVWNNSNNDNVFIKPLSFDLADALSIQTKSATYLGYLTHLSEYAKTTNARFDFLVTKPQNSSLTNDFNNALDLLSYAKDTPKIFIIEDKWEKYSDEIISSL